MTDQAFHKDKKKNKYDYWCCPKCGWDAGNWGHEYKENCEVKEFISGNSVIPSGDSWVEIWTCPKCGEVFEFQNGT